MRIGVGAGESTVEDDDYFGMPSIEAARLCDKAPSDGILASTMAQMMAGRQEGFEFESVGMLELKGIPDPVEAFAVGWEPAGEQESVRRSVLPTVLRSVPQIAYVGRVEEHERLKAHIREVREHRRRTVFLAGEPGVGKTRLAAHTAIELHNAGFTVCWGAATQDLGAPYGPWIQALSHYVEHAPEEVLAGHVERHGREVTRLVRDSVTKRLGEGLAPQHADPETERYQLFEAVTNLLDAASDQTPMVLVLDDLHWADGQTLSLLKHVAAATPDSALLVIATYRESDLDRGHTLADVLADLRRVEGVERLSLQGLGSDDVAELVVAVGGLETDAVGHELAGEIVEETDGNPFFVAELVRHLTESGGITRGSDGRSELRSSIADLEVPSSLREVLCRRVGRLGERPEEILTVAAVLGRTFDIELLERVVGCAEEELLDALDGALQGSLLVEAVERVGRFRFTHALINHALYDALSATRRTRLHRRVAEALEQLCSDERGERLVDQFLEETVGSAGGSAALLAYHWREAGDSERAVDFLLIAGERAEAGGARTEAVGYYSQALELIPESAANRQRVNLKRAVAYARLFHVEDAAHALRAKESGK